MYKSKFYNNAKLDYYYNSTRGAMQDAHMACELKARRSFKRIQVFHLFLTKTTVAVSEVPRNNSEPKNVNRMLQDVPSLLLWPELVFCPTFRGSAERFLWWVVFTCKKVKCQNQNSTRRGPESKVNCAFDCFYFRNHFLCHLRLTVYESAICLNWAPMLPKLVSTLSLHSNSLCACCRSEWRSSDGMSASSGIMPRFEQVVSVAPAGCLLLRCGRWINSNTELLFTS